MTRGGKQPAYPYGGAYRATDPKANRLRKKNGLRPIRGPLSSVCPMGMPPASGVYDELRESRSPMQKAFFRPISHMEVANKRQLGPHIVKNKFQGFLPQIKQNMRGPVDTVITRNGMSRFNAHSGHEVQGPIIPYPNSLHG